MYPAATSYNKDIDRYSCTGTIVMTAPNGFYQQYMTPIIAIILLLTMEQQL